MWVSGSVASAKVIGDAGKILIGILRPCRLKARAMDMLSPSGGGITVYVVYFSPNRNLSDFEIFLNRLETSMRRLASGQVLVLEDFNAKSIAWDAPAMDVRGGP